MVRRHLVGLICLLMVSSVLVVAPAAAAPQPESVTPSGGATGVEVPDASLALNPPPRLSAGARDALPDPDAGRTGLVSGYAFDEVGRGGGPADLGNLPVSVVVDGEVFAEPVAVDVEVLDPTKADTVSPFVGVAVRVDLFEAGNTTRLGERSAEVTIDFSEVPLGYAAGLFERIRVYSHTDCVQLPDDTLVCADKTEVESRLMRRDRTITFRVTDSDLRQNEEAAGSHGAAFPLSAGLSGAGWGTGPPVGGWFTLGSGLSGPSGNFTASPHSTVADYQVSPYTGHFRVTYPIEVPPAFFGPQPSVALTYDSGAVDGMTAAANTLPGPAGLGWSYHPGFVRRILPRCDEEYSWPGSNDLCAPFEGEDFTLELNGVSVGLVEVDTTNRIFRATGGQFWEAQLHDGATNGDSEGEWWELTTPDGYTYQFGREEVAAYNSLQYVRIFVPNGENPNVWCNDTTNVYCNKAYQWNLEKITDPDGYELEIYYTEETNYFHSAIHRYARSLMESGR